MIIALLWWSGTESAVSQVGLQKTIKVVNICGRDREEENANYEAGPTKLRPLWELQGMHGPSTVVPQWTKMAGPIMSIITECGLLEKSVVPVSEVALQQRASPQELVAVC